MSTILTFNNPNGLPNHLGGHENETHTDQGAIDFLKYAYDIKSVLDVGCGPGGMVTLFKESGLDVLGVDGDDKVERPEELKNLIRIHDYTKGYANLEHETYDVKEKLHGVHMKFDLAWCVEFVEHVEARYIHNFVDSFKHCKYVVMTHALPGQPGHHHVNCQPIEYWIHIMLAFGLGFDPDNTNKLRQASTMKERYIRTQSLFLHNLDYKND